MHDSLYHQDKAISVKPAAQNLFLPAAIYESLQQDDKAREAFIGATERYHKNDEASACAQLANSCSLFKLYGKAEMYYKKAIVLAADRPVFYLYLTLVCAVHDRLFEAKDEANKALLLSNDTKMKRRIKRVLAKISKDLLKMQDRAANI